VVPWVVSLLTAGMVAVTFLIWVGKYWPVWRRVYYSLLSLSALVFVGVMARWDMLTVFW
jgi:hypothetical protein